MTVEERLASLGISLPEPPSPVASYLPGVICGDLVFVSGQLPAKQGSLIAKGKVGLDLTEEEGAAAAAQAAVNCLGVLKSLAGSLDNVEQIVKVTGYVQSADDFYAQARVINGASDLLQKVLGEKGRHARAAIGVNSLPLNAPCEIELIARLKGEKQ